MNRANLLAVAMAAGIGALGAAPVCLADDADKFGAYREAVSGFSPGDFWIDDGERLFHAKRGPNEVSLEQCDFGKGPGVIDGVYAEMPRYFEDTGRVETLEGRLLTCMTELQGRKREDILEMHYVNAAEEDDRPSELAQLSAYIASHSNGRTFDTKPENEAERHAYELGKKVFWRRMGAMDLSCANCHGHDDRVLRGVELPNLLDPETAGRIMGAFPAYVLKDANVRTQWWRNQRCILAMRLPWLRTGSDIDTALTLFMTIQASDSDEEIKVPGTKPRA